MRLLLLLVILFVSVLPWLGPPRTEGFRSKCFSCEGQDQAAGIWREYGSKCFSCEGTIDVCGRL
jgi:hypothetical protein